MANTTDRLYRMPIGDFLRRRPEAQTCQACGSLLPHGAVFCPSCGVRTDDPQAEPLHIVDRTPPQLLAILPDTDVAGTAHAANRVLVAVNDALKPQGAQAAVGLVCIRPGQRVRAGAVIESASRSLRSGRPEMMGKPA